MKYKTAYGVYISCMFVVISVGGEPLFLTAIAILALLTILDDLAARNKLNQG